MSAKQNQVSTNCQKRASLLESQMIDLNQELESSLLHGRSTREVNPMPLKRIS